MTVTNLELKTELILGRAKEAAERYELQHKGDFNLLVQTVAEDAFIEGYKEGFIKGLAYSRSRHKETS